MNLTCNMLRKIAQGVLEREYGFAPGLMHIRLLEASGDGQYILFAVREHEYSYDGITLEKRS